MQQQQVAALIGMDGSVYGRVESGARPLRALELRDVARALGVSPEALLRAGEPVAVEEQVLRLTREQMTVHRVLAEFATATGEALEAVDAATEPAPLPGEGDGAVDTGEELVAYLAHQLRHPRFAGMAPGDPRIRAVLQTLVDSVAPAATPDAGGDRG